MSAHAKAAGAAAYSLQNWSEAADKFSEAIDAVAGCRHRCHRRHHHDLPPPTATAATTTADRHHH